MDLSLKLLRTDFHVISTYLCAKSFQLCPTLCHPMDCSPPGSSVHGILQAGILEWVACPSPGDLSDLGNIYLLQHNFKWLSRTPIHACIMMYLTIPYC